MGECTQDTRGPFLKTGNGRSGVGGLDRVRQRIRSAPRGLRHLGAGHEGAGYTRHTHWAPLNLTATSDPAKQYVSLG